MKQKSCIEVSLGETFKKKPTRDAIASISNLREEVTAHLLVVDGEKRYVSHRYAIKVVSARLQEILETLIVLTRPWHGKEVSIVYSPIEWRCGRHVALNGVSGDQRPVAELCVAFVHLGRDVS